MSNFQCTYMYIILYIQNNVHVCTLKIGHDIGEQCFTMCIISGLYRVVFHTQTCFWVSLCIFCMYTENYHINVEYISAVCHYNIISGLCCVATVGVYVMSV